VRRFAEGRNEQTDRLIDMILNMERIADINDITRCI
jgi:hypothetical protein